MADRPYRIEIAPAATRDLARHYNYIFRSSPAGAQSLQNQLLSQIARLDQFPARNIVKVRRGLPSIRSVVVESYLIFFSVNENRHLVTVLRIRHGAQKKLKRFE